MKIIGCGGICFYLLLCWTTSALSKKRHIDRPKSCDKSKTWFRPGKSFHYIYTSTSESAFVGTSDSKSGFQFSCQIYIEAPRHCEALMRVRDCQLYKMLPGPAAGYVDDAGTQKFNNTMSKHSIYFKHNKGEILPESLVIADGEPVTVVNIKRGILSALQLKLLQRDEFDQSHTQKDIFGSCPTTYVKQSTSPLKVVTQRDLTTCIMPHLFNMQRKPFSMIQVVYGGYRESEIEEPVYPFGSTVNCEYTVNKRQRISDIQCLQQQYFRPAAYNETFYVTAMTNVTQKLTLSEVKKHKSRYVDRHLKDRKYAPIKFEFEDKPKVIVTKSDIIRYIHLMVNQFYSGVTQNIPQQYHQMVLSMRNAKKHTLHEVMKEVWRCHGNNTYNCDAVTQMLEKDYFLDGLLSCASPNCLAVFSHCFSNHHVSNPFINVFFMYDLALHHPPFAKVIDVLLDTCKTDDSVSCWMPLSIMLNKFLKDKKSLGKKNAAYKALEHVRKKIGGICDKGVWRAMPESQKEQAMKTTITMLKVIGNVGTTLQNVYDTIATDDSKTIIPAVLRCVKNPDLPYKITKAAVHALQKMKVYGNVKATLFEVLTDMKQPIALRTTAFGILAKEVDEGIIKQLIEIMHTDPMDYMRTYIAIYIEGVLENDQPDLERYRILWKKCIEDNGKSLPKHPRLMIGRSRYMEMSRYFKFPLVATFYGLQMEMDLVYDPASPVVRSTVIRINYFNGKKNNILEFGIDVEGLESLVEAVTNEKGKGLIYLYSLFSKFSQMSEMSNKNNQKDRFGIYHTEIVQELRKMFERINFPQFGVPDGVLHWKVFDNEVMYADLPDVLKILNSTKIEKKAGGILETIMYHINKGFHIVKTRSAKHMDLVKMLPTLSGAPLNLTVQVTSFISGELNAKINLKLFLLVNGPIEATTAGGVKGAIEFVGQMQMEMAEYSSSGIRMTLKGQIGNNVDSEINISEKKSTPDIIKQFVFSIESTNIDKQFLLAKYKSTLLHLHHGHTGEEEIEPDSSYETEFQKCILQPLSLSLLTENELCIRTSYPNTVNSSTHPYFPLSGPFEGQIFLKPGNQKYDKIKLVADLQNRKTKEGIQDLISFNLAAKGKISENKLEMTLSRSEVSGIKLSINMPKSGMLFTAEKQYRYLRDNQSSTTTRLFDFHLQKGTKSLRRFLLKNEENRTKETVPDQKNKNTTKEIYKTKYHSQVEIAAPNISLSVEFQTRKENVGFVFLNWTYYCTKDRPLLYLLHLDPQLAASNGDISNIMLSFDEIIGYSPMYGDNWIAKDNLKLSYPGQTIILRNDMVSNDTFAHRDTTLSYVNGNGEKELIVMKSHVKNESLNHTNMHYCYVMKLNISNKYDVDLDGHLYSSNGKYELTSDFTVKNLQIKINKKSMSHRSINDSCLEELQNRDSWHFNLNFTTDRTKTYVGHNIQTEYKLSVMYPYCNSYRQFLSEGTYVRMRKPFGFFKNSSIRFRAVFTPDTSLSSPAISINQPSPGSSIIRYEGDSVFTLRTFHINSKLEYSHGINNTWTFGQNVNFTSTRLNCVTAEVHAYQNTPMESLNFDNKATFSGTEHCNDFTSSLDIINFLFKWSQNTSFSINKGFNLSSQIKAEKRFPVANGGNSLICSVKAKLGSRILSSMALSCHKEGSNMALNLESKMMNPKLINTSLSMQEINGHSEQILSWFLSHTGSTSVLQTIDWNPKLTRSLFTTLAGMKMKLGHAFINAGEQVKRNMQREFLDYNIIFVDKSPRMLLKQYVVPILVRIPLAKHVTTRYLQHKSKTSNNSITSYNSPRTTSSKGGILWLSMMKFKSDALKGIGQMMIDPPQIFTPYTQSGIFSSLKQALMTHEISFSSPLPFKLKDFRTFPEQTIGEKYISNIIFRKLFHRKPSSHSVIARIYKWKWIQTFNGKVFKIPDVSRECTHLLTGDMKTSKFALVMSGEELTLLSSSTTVTIDRTGKIYLPNCEESGLPFSWHTSYKNITIKQRKRLQSVEISTGFGMKLSCKFQIQYCTVSVDSKFHNQTVGLLGVTDFEKGTDFRIRNGTILQDDVPTFVKDYQISGQTCSTLGNTPVVKSNSCNIKCSHFKNGGISTKLCPQFDLMLPHCEDSNCKSTECAYDCDDLYAYLEVCPTKKYWYSNIFIKNGHGNYTPQPIVKSSSFPVDLVLVVAEANVNFNNTVSIIYNIIQKIAENRENIRVGILGYGKTQHQISNTRYFADIKDVKMTNIQQFWRSDNSLMYEASALRAALRYPFRLLSKKLVVLVTPHQEATSEADVDDLVQLYTDKSVLFDAISKYPELKQNNLLGINWDKEALFSKEFKTGIASLPNVELMRLVEETYGAVFDLDPLVRDLKRKMRIITEFIDFQIAGKDIC